MRYTLASLLFALGFLMSGATVTNNIEYVRRASGPLLLDASIPDGAGPFSAVLIVHGGGFTSGNKRMYVTPVFEPLTRSGFAWFTIDYRLAPGATAEDQVDDVMSALAWLNRHAAEYKVDRRRIALLGESAGAYLVDYVAMIAPKETPIAAVVSFYGPADLTLEFKDRPIPDFMRTFFGVGEAKDSAGDKILRAKSPYYMVHRNLPPFLLVHGTADELVPYEQSVQFCKALKAQGNKCELYTVAGARHGVGPWEAHSSQQGYKKHVVKWLEQTLR